MKKDKKILMETKKFERELEEGYKANYDYYLNTDKEWQFADRFIDINEQKLIAEARELFNEEVDIERETEILTRVRVIGESIRFAKICKK